MRHLRAERWSRRDSFVHRLHPTAKIIAALAVLIGIALPRHSAPRACGVYLLLLIGATLAARLPPGELLLQSAKVLPFAVVFAMVSLLAGDRDRAWGLLGRSYTSCYCGLLLIGSTSIPSLIRGLETLQVPPFLLLVMHFLFRYAAVLFGEAAAIRDASISRGGSVRNLQFRQAGAAVGVLFARAYARSSAIHQAMVARGFEGRIPTLGERRFAFRDGLAAVTMIVVATVIGIALR